MPELPEVETVRRGLEQVTLNRLIEGGDVLLARTIAHPDFVADFLAGVKGTLITSWQRRGKYLLAKLQHPQRINYDPGWLGVHLRMTGQLLWLEANQPLQKHTRVRLFFAEGWELQFVDQRTFGQIWWVPSEHQPEYIISGLSHLGPEPFAPEFTVDYLSTALKRSRRPIKSALLDQSLVAGVGNIYADEALFQSGILPTTLAMDLKPKQLQKLHAALVQVLQSAIAAGGTTFSNFLNVKGINGNYGGEAWVYDRKGEPCRLCATPIQRLRLAGRSTHFCPHCQS